MFRRFLAASVFVLGLGAVSGVLRADNNYAPARTYQVGISSITFFTIAVSSWQATQMDSPALKERVAIEVQNLDATGNLWCVPGVSISSAPVNLSRKIASGGTWVVSMLDTFPGPNSSTLSPHVYCMTDIATTTSTAVVTQLK